METDQPAPENPDKASSDEQGASPARSYDCTFCKRGFSNAQALGGHMNIHRRDKAKLKQPSPTHETTATTQQSNFDISRIIPSYSHTPSSHGKWRWVLQDDGADARTDKTSDHIVGSQIRQLPLFDEKPSKSDQNPRSQVQEGLEKGFSSTQPPLGSELDLELRLGPEPHDSSPPKTTKKFF
ncbi:hypothetical protein Godav_024780 [Gossypium davidsonii]|uniref:C2H2-type domain-containing protein n=2 Tax=Gossypium TaxID=3633 RepID=A0A7J8T830_GOSDV|nr:hypothetical protein [Gossypium davidsonii]MBA0639685.1 hypothetical protein [Gossypium klotzschianum]